MFPGNMSAGIKRPVYEQLMFLQVAALQRCNGLLADVTSLQGKLQSTGKSLVSYPVFKLAQ